MDCSMSASSVLHIFCSLLKFTSTEPVMLTKHLILCCPLLLLTSIFLSIRVFFSEWALHIKWPKYWSFSNSPSNEYSGLIFFRIGWFDLLAVQGILKSLLQHHSSKASFFGAQPSLWSNSHIHTWLLEKTTALTIQTLWEIKDREALRAAVHGVSKSWTQTFVGKGMSLLFNMLSRFVIAFLPRSKCLSITWLQSWNLEWFWCPRK